MEDDLEDNLELELVKEEALLSSAYCIPECPEGYKYYGIHVGHGFNAYHLFLREVDVERMYTDLHGASEVSSYIEQMGFTSHLKSRLLRMCLVSRHEIMRVSTVADYPLALTIVPGGGLTIKCEGPNNLYNADSGYTLGVITLRSIVVLEAVRLPILGVRSPITSFNLPCEFYGGVASPSGYGLSHVWVSDKSRVPLRDMPAAKNDGWHRLSVAAPAVEQLIRSTRLSLGYTSSIYPPDWLVRVIEVVPDILGVEDGS